MIVVIIQLDASPQKRNEFLMTISGMIGPTRSEKGCLGHHFSKDVEDENRFFIMQCWQDQAGLERHWCSDRFGVFLGSFHLLKKTPDIKIHAVTFTAGIEAAKAAREKIKCGTQTLRNQK